MKLFKKEIDESALPKHKIWDHNILLILRIILEFEPIYVLFYTKLEII